MDSTPQAGIDGVCEAVHHCCDKGREAAENVFVELAAQEADCRELVGYVDDGAYSYAHSDPSVLSMVLTEKYNMLEEWMDNNKLVINPDKNHLMVMGNNNVANLRQQVTMMARTFIIT